MLTKLEYIVNHVFFPPKLPQSDDSSVEHDLAICDLVVRNARAFAAPLQCDESHWKPIVAMLINLTAIYSMSSLDKQELHGLVARLVKGDTLVIPVRAQNACVIIRRLEASTIYETFEVDPQNEQVMATTGRLVRLFPGTAFELADSASTSAFQRELASFLADMDVVDAGSAAFTTKAGSNVFEARDTADPHYITQLLSSILHGCPGSQPAEIERITKRVRNEILWHNAYAPWRRSPLWLVIRVSIQTALQRASDHGQAEYKAFMIFLLADVVLSGDECRGLPTDLLICIQNKIVRRLRKISDTVSDALLCRATEAISKVKEIVEDRWKDIRSQQALASPWSPESLDVTQDTAMSLLSSKDYLLTRLQQNDTSVSFCKFEPPKISRLTAGDFLHPKVVSAALSREPLIALTDIEWFSVRSLETWVHDNRSNPSACSAIGECIKCYADTAQRQYKGNPEDQSIMLLTIFLLWSALDRLAIVHCPLLASYSPEVPETILNPILLRKSEHIQSLLTLRKYLRIRHKGAKHGSIFSDKLSQTSFSIRYFLGPSSLQKLKQQIEASAQAERQKKRQEFTKFKAKYIKLTKEAGSMGHSHHNEPKKTRRGVCKKCSLTAEAARLKIKVHEWPLPCDPFSAQATVFELQCPPVLQAWRSMTYTILYDFCRPGLPVSGKSRKAEMLLANYEGLKKHCKSHSRIIYASSTKPFTQSHYSKQKIANIDISSILVNNGLQYQLYDTVLKRWVKGSFSDSSVDSLCKFNLQSTSPYYSLQYAIQGTMHSANQPIAEQGSVPPEISVHEYIAFGTLRSGAMVQWFNILRELRAQTLSFDRIEVHMLLAQAALETGNLVEQGLEWHHVLQHSDFSAALLSEVDQVLSSIESNWHHIVTLQTVVILTSRLLACAKEAEILEHACSTLRVARTIAFSWVQQLVHDLSEIKKSETQNEGISNHIRQRRAIEDCPRNWHRLFGQDAKPAEQGLTIQSWTFGLITDQDRIGCNYPNKENIGSKPQHHVHRDLLASDGTLIIQAEVGNDIFELVPDTAFRKNGGDFPVSFIRDYAHWLHLSPTSRSGRVEFHPLHSIWLPSEDNWVLTFSVMGNATMKSGNGSVMIDILSKTFSMISKCLDRLDVPSQVHITLDADGTLSAKLPRYNLAFFVNENKDIECSSLRDMVVDSDQSSGTMYGLTKQLVIRSKSLDKTRIGAPSSRCVIIPFGRGQKRLFTHWSPQGLSRSRTYPKKK
ncbi:hypothetical protein C0993_011063 [Termitomyces sp. T159_Od127]|nr:hypothetical protein C0993_011063 [Termitomyces sp. T159_Od127]